MEVSHFARTCRYATPTLFLQWPYWLDAWSWAWSCTKDGRLRLLRSDAGCRGCPRWDLREAGAKPRAFDAAQRILKD
jgi:hypothetical protein